MYLVVISGLPCSGKSKLAERLQAELCWPLLCKDAYKELLFDSLGYSDRAWSKRISTAAYAAIFAQAEQLTAHQINCAIEGNFRWDEHQSRFERLQSRATVVQVRCMAQPDILLERFRLRAASGLRHPGHVDTESLSEIERELLVTPQRPLPMSGTVIECDTSDDWQGAIAVAIAKTKLNVVLAAGGCIR